MLVEWLFRACVRIATAVLAFAKVKSDLEVFKTLYGQLWQDVTAF